MKGYSLIEAVIAMALLSSISGAALGSLVAARRAARTVDYASTATQLAASGLEELRATGQLSPCPDDQYERHGTLTPWLPHLGLSLARVHVESRQYADVVIDLETAVRR